MVGAATVLQEAAAQARQDIASLEAQIAAVMAASADSNADDEHDPEGSTIAFERAQAQALLDAALARLAEIVTAQGRLADGTYGTCRVCGRAVELGRLDARPFTDTCRVCAGG